MYCEMLSTHFQEANITTIIIYIVKHYNYMYRTQHPLQSTQCTNVNSIMHNLLCVWYSQHYNTFWTFLVMCNDPFLTCENAGRAPLQELYTLSSNVASFPSSSPPPPPHTHTHTCVTSHQRSKSMRGAWE